MGKSQRTKGIKGELEVVHFWKDVFPDARRNFEFRASEAEDGVDVILDDRNAIQVKIGSQVPKKVYDYIEQIKHKKGRLSWVQMRRDNKEPLIVMRAKDFKELI
jgi:hypothetical protein